MDCFNSCIPKPRNFRTILRSPSAGKLLLFEKRNFRGAEY
jgi:hypothetical protein